MQGKENKRMPIDFFSLAISFGKEFFKIAGGDDQEDALVESDIKSQAASINLDAVSAVRLVLASMNATNMDSYFMSLEFWFASSGIQWDQLKYNITMAQVPPQKLRKLRSIIEATPQQH